MEGDITYNECDGVYMMVSFKKITEGYLFGKSETVVSFLNKFLEYFGEDLSIIKTLTEADLKRFIEHILNSRNGKGQYLKTGGLTVKICIIGAYLNRLKAVGLVKHNPFYPVNRRRYDRMIREIQANIFESRRKQRLFSLKGEILIDNYIGHAGKHNPTSNFHAYKVVPLLDLKDYILKHNLDIYQLQEKHVNALMEYWFSKVGENGARHIDDTIVRWLYALHCFYRYIHEEGYHDRQLFADYDKPMLRERVTKERPLFDQRNNRKRRYTLKEILKIYQKHLRQTFEDFRTRKERYNDLKRFIRYLGQGDITLYKVDQKTVQDFAEHLFNHEYEKGRFYKPQFQRDILSNLKKFYDWFCVSRYKVDNPFEGFNMQHHLNGIQKRYDKRDKSLEHRLVPACFEDSYQRATLFEYNTGLVKETVMNHQKGWQVFLNYAYEQGIEDLSQVDELVLEQYQLYVNGLKNSQGLNLSINTKLRHLVAVKTLFRYLTRFRYIPYDPSHVIQLPKKAIGLPTSGMTDREVKRMLTGKNPVTDKEIRNRAILETLYSGGMRSNELRSLKITDIDWQGGFIRVNTPKGGVAFQRVVPVGREALQWIEKYLDHIRPKHALTEDEEYLFISRYGKKLSSAAVLNIVKSNLSYLGYRRKIVTHSFRVSCGTEMLRNDADLKYVQQQLGHRNIASTEKYMRLVPGDLKKVHEKCHPRKKWEKKSG